MIDSNRLVHIRPCAPRVAFAFQFHVLNLVTFLLVFVAVLAGEGHGK